MINKAQVPNGSTSDTVREVTGTEQKPSGGSEEQYEVDGESSSHGDETMRDTLEGSSDASDSLPDGAPQGRKRKREASALDDIEDRYMRRMGRKEENAAKEKGELENQNDEESSSDGEISEESSAESGQHPVHESLTNKNDEIERSNRTVFLGNVSTQAIRSKSSKKILQKHLTSFLPALPESTGPHRIESIRFRSTAFAGGNHIPKRASFAHKEVMDETTPSTNAYVVYSSVPAARKAPSVLNGTVVLDRHLRVDSVAHPSEINHKRCVFVGNLDFVDQAADDGDAEQKKKKRTAPADVEEGLWRVFNNIQDIANSDETGENKEKKKSKHDGNNASENGKAIVESVRVIRDRATRVGKGFAYVQFHDANHVEAALLADGKKFKPMLPRKLRVVRAKKVISNKKNGQAATKAKSKAKAGSVGGEERRTLHGRAAKLFGKGGAAKLKRGDSESAVFEGHRATSNDGSRVKVKTKSRGSKGKPKTRSTRRAAAYRASSGK